MAILSPRHPLPAPPLLVLLVGTEPDSAVLLRENIRILVVPREDERGQLEVHIRGGWGAGCYTRSPLRDGFSHPRAPGSRLLTRRASSEDEGSTWQDEA